MSKTEKRTLLVTDLEVRESATEGGDEFVVRGHALTFDDPYPVMDFEEQFSAEAVRDDIQETDVFAFWAHDSSVPLARTKNGTLKLAKDETGLAVEFPLPSSRVQEAEAIRTGLVDKMSVGFRVRKQAWEIDRENGLPDLRTILSADILEVSPVAIPANPNTDLGKRDVQAAIEARDAARAELREEREREELEREAEREHANRMLSNRIRLAERAGYDQTA